MVYPGDGQHAAPALRVTSTRSTTSAYVSLFGWFPHGKPRQCLLFRREAPRAHNLNIKWQLQKCQFNVRFGTGWQHYFGLPRAPPFKRSRIIKFLCPDIARHIGVKQLSIHIEWVFMIKASSSIPPRRQPPITLAPRPNAFICDGFLCFIMGMANTLPGHCVSPRREHHMSVCIVIVVVSTRQAAPALRFIPSGNTLCPESEHKTRSQQTPRFPFSMF